MDKSAKRSAGTLRIELFRVNYTRLCNFWKKAVLTGTFWCLYWNDAPGAGVFNGGKRLELMPDKLYIISPDANLNTWCDSDEVSQFYCHFYMPGVLTRQKIVEIDLSPELDALRSIAFNAWQNMSEDNYFPALALISAALYYSKLNRIKSGSTTDLEMELVRREIELNIGSPLIVTELARKYSLSEKEFSARFRNAFGVTPFRYISLLRYEHAALRLRNSDDTIEEICEIIGCRDRNYFTRCFTKHFGIPPAAYRKRLDAGRNTQ